MVARIGAVFLVLLSWSLGVACAQQPAGVIVGMKRPDGTLQNVLESIVLTMENIDMKRLEGMPQDVVDVILRVDGCTHWSGEGGFDEQRAAEIDRALEKLKCADLPKDVKTLSRKYAGTKTVSENLDSISREFLLPAYDPFETERLTADMPPDVTDLVLRADQCTYWKHEPSSPERDELKAIAVEQLHCKDLREEWKFLSGQYASSEPIGKVLKRLDEFYLR